MTDISILHSSTTLKFKCGKILTAKKLTNNDSIAASKVSFSSYAGYLESLDDFYVMNSGLVMLQTTINCLNHTLYQYVEPSRYIGLYFYVLMRTN